MSIRAAAAFILAASALAGCAGSPSDGHRGATTPTTTARATESLIYSAVLRQLILVDNTFTVAKGVSPFTRVYIVDGVSPRSAQLSLDAEGEPFSEDLKREIASQSTSLPPVEFIADPEDKVDPKLNGMSGVVDNGVIVGLGAIEHQNNTSMHVGAGFFCGSVCGTGLTYVVEKIDGQWQITGNTGPFSIS
jgi:hypothetical protein